MARYEPPVRSSGLDDLERRMRGPDIDEGSAGAQMATSVVLPGAATMRRTPWLGVVLLVLGVALPLGLVAWVIVRRSDLLGLGLEPRFLSAVAVVATAFVLTRLLAIGEVAHAFRHSPGVSGRTAVAIVTVLALGVPLLWTAARADQARRVVRHVFAADDGEPLFTPAAGGGVDPRTVTTILLLGGVDPAGGGSPAPETLTLITVDHDSGRTALLSIPNDLTGLSFSPGSELASQFPGGPVDLVGVAPTGETGEDASMGAFASRAGAAAVSQAVGYSLDVQIDDYAVVDVGGLTGFVDAVGGVIVQVVGVVPLPPGPPGEDPRPAVVGPGPVEMDGALATAYARSGRAGSNDQVERQRQVLTAVGDEMSAAEVVGGFGTLAGVLDTSLRTSMSIGEFTRLIERIGDADSVHESVGLPAPSITSGTPDYDQIRQLVDAVQAAVQAGDTAGTASAPGS